MEKEFTCSVREKAMKETGETGKDMDLVNTYLQMDKYSRESIEKILDKEKEPSTVQTWL